MVNVALIEAKRRDAEANEHPKEDESEKHLKQMESSVAHTMEEVGQGPWGPQLACPRLSRILRWC